MILGEMLLSAKKRETIFRKLLTRYGFRPGNHSIEQLLDKYSMFERDLMILDFKEIDDDVVEFSWGNSDRGRTDWWSLEDDNLKHVKNTDIWRS